MRAFNIILVPWFLRQCPFKCFSGNAEDWLLVRCTWKRECNVSEGALSFVRKKRLAVQARLPAFLIREQTGLFLLAFLHRKDQANRKMRFHIFETKEAYSRESEGEEPRPGVNRIDTYLFHQQGWRSSVGARSLPTSAASPGRRIQDLNFGGKVARFVWWECHEIKNI